MKKITFILFFLLIYTQSVWSQHTDTIGVSGACDMCKNRIEKTALSVKGIVHAEYNIGNQQLAYTHNTQFTENDLHLALMEVGHDTEKMRAPDAVYKQLHACCQYRSEENDPVPHPAENPVLSSPEHKMDPILRGHIFEEDETGQRAPLIGVNVRWEGADNGAVTDLDGFFEIGRIGRTSDLILSYVGYQSDTLDVSGINVLEWSLSNGVKLTDIEVVYRKKTSSVSFIEPLQITEMNEAELCKAACCSLSESFETNPAVDASFTDAITGTRQIQMLGLAGKYVQITSELIPDVRSTSVIEGLDYIPGAWIQSIQLSKGTGSVAQGFESMTGQINVELRKPETKERFFLNLYGNEGGRFEGNLIAKYKLNPKLSTALLLHGKSQHRLHDRNRDSFLDMPVGQNYYIQNRWKFQNPNGWQSSLSVKYVKQDAFGGQTTFQPKYNSDPGIWGYTKNVERKEAWVKLGKYLNHKRESSFGVQLSFKDHRDQRVFGQRNLNISENNIFANALYESNLAGKNHKLKVGLTALLDHYQESLDLSKVNNRENILGGFAEYTYKAGENITLVGGLRMDRHNRLGWMWVPRFHFRYAPNDDTVLRLSTGKGWRTARVYAENARFLASNRGIAIVPTDPTLPYGLKPEINWNFGINLTRHIHMGGREGILTADYYFTRFENQIVPDYESDAVGTVIITNQDLPTQAHSVQAQLDYEVLPKLDMRMAYRFNISKAYFGNQEKTTPMSPFHRAFINLGYEAKDKWFFDLTVHWTGRQRLPGTLWMQQENQLMEEAEDFITVMAQVRKLLNENFEMYLGAENLLDYRLDHPIVSSTNPGSSDFDASLVWGPIFGRNIYMGLRYRFG